jgi:hypothetical protein
MITKENLEELVRVAEEKHKAIIAVFCEGHCRASQAEEYPDSEIVDFCWGFAILDPIVEEHEIVEWAFSIFGSDEFNGYDTAEEALAGIERMVAKGILRRNIDGPYPIFEGEV